MTLLAQALGLLALASPQAPLEAERPYDVEQGILEIEKVVETQVLVTNERREVYFRDWGRVMATHTTIRTTVTFSDKTTERRLFSLKEDGFTVTVDLATMKGARMPDAATMAPPDEDGSAARERAERRKRVLGEAKPIGSREIAGKTCEGSETLTHSLGQDRTTRTWSWKRIPFAVESTMPNSEIRETVLRASFDVELPEEKMRLPEGAKVKDWEPAGR